MPKPINEVHFGGHAGRDAESKYTGSGSLIVSFSIAVGGGEYKGKTYPVEWVNCEAWNMEELSQVKKGDYVEVWGRQRTEEWTDKNTGMKRTKQKCSVTKFELAENREPLPHPAPAANIHNVGITDDDIPF